MATGNGMWTRGAIAVIFFSLLKDNDRARDDDEIFEKLTRNRWSNQNKCVNEQI